MDARGLVRATGAIVIAGFFAAPALAQSVAPGASAPVDGDALDLRARATSIQLGPKLAPGADALPELPLGLRYRDDTKSVVRSLDDRSGWAMGVGSNPDTARPVELSPNSSLGLLPKPGARLLLEKRF